MTSLGVSIITKNAQQTLGATLKSVNGWVEEIVIVDDYSTDNTQAIAHKFTRQFIQHRYEGEGAQRSYALAKMSTDWVLILDADEVVPLNLKKEIQTTIKTTLQDGFRIPIQSHLFGKPIHYGGEDYKKLILFRRKNGYSTKDEIHAHYNLHKGEVGELKHKLNHYSYLSMRQMFLKFTSYSYRLARQKKQQGEKTSFKKICCYGPHMFYARYIKAQGYKDGYSRLFLDILYSYMESLTYFLMLFIK